jgi:hypothetical protein
MVMDMPPRWTVSAPPIVHKITMNVAAERTAVIIPVTKSTGDSVARPALRTFLSAGPTPQIKLENWNLALQLGGSLLGKWNWAEFEAFPQTRTPTEPAS